MSSEVKKKERQNLLVQVEDFLNKQQYGGQTFKKKNEIQEEVDVFLNLLGNINPSETPQNKTQLSIIISQGSYDSTLPSFRETKLKYVNQFVQQMLKFLREIKKQIQQNESNIKQKIDQIYQFYLNQMDDIDKLIQYTYDVGNKKPKIVEQNNYQDQKEIKGTLLEQELESSLVQAHQLNVISMYINRINQTIYLSKNHLKIIIKKNNVSRHYNQLLYQNHNYINLRVNFRSSIKLLKLQMVN
ncbi:unnamed protein product [Paramecium sonneborni]|uniref:Uncharacterized protein n=1 Tax=Paramecium sonneborni TaxID=65129 RepID=A0A8S1RC03_9CILI|nr:unnamed protein product [Paramecium sonneborni]